MSNIVLNQSWEDNFLYGTRMHHSVMKKYCNYFKQNFKSQINQFGYFRHYQDGHFIAVSDNLKHEELYLEHTGYKDDPHHLNFNNIRENFAFDWPNRKKTNIKHNAFRLAIYREFGTYGTVCVVAKTHEYYHAFWWGFISTPRDCQKDQLVVLQDFFTKRKFVRLCLAQCKKAI